MFTFLRNVIRTQAGFFMPECTLCGRAASEPLCLSCLSQWISASAWTGCTRCGRNECVACDELAPFASVRSFLRLDSISARLLLDAKDRDDVQAQLVLDQLIDTFFARSLQGLKVSHVVVSPVRLQRLGEATWHPALAMERTARKFPLRVLTPFISGVGRQTTLTTQERARHKEEGRLHFSRHESKWLEETPSGVVFLDDVLTSGGVAARTKHLFPRSFQGTEWHLLTVFRTPKATGKCLAPS